MINTSINPSGNTKHKADKIIEVYKNGMRDGNWKFANTLAYGNARAYIYGNEYDPTAEYTVTYFVLDRHQFTNNATEVKAAYAKNIRSALDDTIARQADIGTTVSVNTRAIVDLYARVKSLEGRI